MALRRANGSWSILVTIDNDATRTTYARAIFPFCDWLWENGVSTFLEIEPGHVAAYINQLKKGRKAPTVKLHLSAIRMLCAWLVTGHIIMMNPAADVKGPKHNQATGTTPVLTPDQVRTLLDDIPSYTLIGLRDRAIIATMAYTVARVSAVTKLTLGDIFREGHGVKLRLQEKGGRQHVMPLHHELVTYLDEYLQEAQLPDDPNHPLFPSATRQRDPELTGKHLDRRNVWDMVKRRAKAAGIDTKVCNHTFRATGITTYLTEGGLLEEAQNMAAHADIRTTRIYDHRSKIVTQSHVERIRY